MNQNQTLIEAKSLCKYFPVSRGLLLKAVDDVSFKVQKSTVLGLVGESGCGKTTIGRLLLNLLRPTSGEVIFDNVNLPSLTKPEMRKMRRRMQIVFQDPYASLNPRMTIGSILTFPMKVQGVYEENRQERAVSLLERVGMRALDMNRYPHEFSGGQLQRIGIARTLAVDPEFIVADEPVSALDVSIQSQVLNLFKELQEEFNLTCLFIAHDLSVVEFISDFVAVIYLGKIVEIAPAEVLYKSHRHPYTKSLLSAIPLPDPKIQKNRPPFTLTGETTSPINPPPGCRFYARCPDRKTLCKEKSPQLTAIGKDHYVSCFRLD
ncbi:MAG: ATP-binding cassette domain-containing protein [Deltaproteobacteria bacterium]|nr:ATP-binding cassette domain-containing protein [Deltaproteobacteria bacterium]MBW2153794.1 ATP-binding cassette domain-containing protein [Deltaproteobacteria bacterium]